MPCSKIKRSINGQTDINVPFTRIHEFRHLQQRRCRMSRWAEDWAPYRHLDMHQAIGAALNLWEQVRFCYQWSHCNNFKLVDSGVRHPSIGYYQSLGRGPVRRFD